MKRGFRRSADALKAATYVEDKESGELRRPLPLPVVALAQPFDPPDHLTRGGGVELCGGHPTPPDDRLFHVIEPLTQ